MCAEIITAKRTAKANKNCWQRSTNVLIHCKQLLVGSYKGEDSHYTGRLRLGLYFCYGKVWFSTLVMCWSIWEKSSVSLWPPRSI